MGTLTQPSSTEISPSLRAYLRDVKDSEPVSREEEVGLAKKAKAGDEGAMAKLITSNLRFVISIAHEYRGSRQPMSELISDGNVGLIEAAKRFDESRGFKFITYAVWWIRQSIRRGMALRRRTVPRPGIRMSDLNTIQRTEEKLAQVLGRTPTVVEIADETKFSVDRVLNAQAAKERDIYLDKPRSEEQRDATLMSLLSDEQPAPDDEAEKRQLADTVGSCLSVLDDRERTIIRWYYGIDGHESVTLKEIGHHLGLTRERIRQLRDIGLTKLRTQCGDVLGEFSRN